MAHMGFFHRVFKDPQIGRKRLLEVVISYSEDVPELFPTVKDIVKYGRLYDQKVKSFLDLLKRETARRRLSARRDSDGADCPENNDGASTSSVGPSGRPQTEMDYSTTDEAVLDIFHGISETERVTDKTDGENTKSSVLDEDGPPAKKKKKKKAKESIEGHVSLEAPTQPENADGSLAVSDGARGNCEADDVKPISEVEEDVTLMDSQIMINTVTSDGIEDAVSNTQSTPRKRTSSDAVSSTSTPFRVIPSAQLMEDPNRFTHFIPPVAGQVVPGTSSAEKKWRVTFEFESSPLRSGKLTPEDVSEALKKYSLSGLRILQLTELTDGSHHVKVEFSCPDFSAVLNKFSGPLSTLRGGPRISRVTEITKGTSVSDDLNLRSDDVSPQNSRLLQLLEHQGLNVSRACLCSKTVLEARKRFVPRHMHQPFMAWMEAQKEELLEDPSRIPTHALFQQPECWFKEFEKVLSFKAASVRTENSERDCRTFEDPRSSERRTGPQSGGLRGRLPSGDVSSSDPRNGRSRSRENERPNRGNPPSCEDRTYTTHKTQSPPLTSSCRAPYRGNPPNREDRTSTYRLQSPPPTSTYRAPHRGNPPSREPRSTYRTQSRENQSRYRGSPDFLPWRPPSPNRYSPRDNPWNPAGGNQEPHTGNPSFHRPPTPFHPNIHRKKDNKTPHL